MFFGGSDDDDGGGFSVGMPSQGSGSKLSSLFGSGPSQGNESLIYKPQKQPTKQKEQPKPAPDAPSLLFATACHAYKYVNGQYATQGKLGAAVLGHFENKDYKILLYGAQKKAITNGRIHKAFKFNVQKNNYATFYDDQSQNWSLCFDNADQLAEFAKWVGLSIYNTSGGELVQQDLNIVDGQEVQKGDTVEMKYTGWFHAGNAFGKVFDSNENTEKLFKFKVGKGKVIKGWDIGVVGMKKGLKRLLVIPPDLAYGAKGAGDRVPPNSTLIFQVQLTRVKFSNPQTEPDNVSLMSVDVSSKDEPKLPPPSAEEPLSPTNQDHETSELNDSISRRTKSISEQLSKTPDTKTKLLERMSKMGQAMIPSPARTTSHEDETMEQSDGPKDDRSKSFERYSSAESHPSDSPRPSIKPKPTNPSPDFQHQPPPQYQQQRHQTPPPSSQQQPQYYQPSGGYPTHMQYQQPIHPMQTQPDQMYLPQQQQLALYQSPQAIQASMFQLPTNLPQASQQAAPPQSTTSSTISSSDINLIMAEGKLHHSEVKSELTRLMDKIDNLQSKINTMETASNRQVAIPQQGPEMEASILMQNITRIIKENEKLNLECSEKGKKIEKLNESMTDLLTKNQSFFEKSNQLLASQSDSMQHNAAQAMAKVFTLEQRNIQLDAELSSTRTQLLLAQKKEESFEEKTAHMTVTIESLQKELKSMKEKAESADNSTTENESMIDELKQQIKSSKKDNKQLKLKLDHVKEEFEECKIENDSITKVLNDLKKKRKEEKEKFGEELDELRNQHEEELKNLKQRYSKNASGEAEKLSKLEAELTQSFEQKMKTKVKSLEDNYTEQIDELKREKSSLADKLDSAKSKLEKLHEELTSDFDQKLQERLAEAKEKHETQLDEVNRETSALKDALQKLENRIKEGESGDLAELEELRSKMESMSVENQKDHDAAYNRGLEEGRATVKTISQVSYDKGFNDGKSSIAVDDKKETGNVSRETVTAEIKKVMNSVFFQLKGEFDVEEEYNGSDVVQTILGVVRDVTLKLTQNKTEEEEEEEIESESELSEDEDDEEEEQEDDEEEIEKENEKQGKTQNQEELAEPIEVEKEVETPPVLSTHYPAEEGCKEPADEGLDVTGQASFDEVDVTAEADSTTDAGKNEEVTAVSQDIEDGDIDSEEPSKETPKISEDLGENKDGKDQDGGESDSEDDDNVSFSSAQSEPSTDNKDVALTADDDTSNTPTLVDNVKETLPPLNAADDVDSPLEEDKEVANVKEAEVDTENKEDSSVENKETSTKTALEQVGLDKSMFGTEEPSEDPLFSSTDAETMKNNDISKTSKEEDDKEEEDHSALFFGSDVTGEQTPKEENKEVKKEEKKDTEKENKKSSLFFEDDSDEDDDFFKPKERNTKSTKASAFSRSPPPLFEDDDDDTNWI